MLRIGTSGWHYPDWRGRFYPHELAAKHWLSYYAHEFDTVEVNNSFYRLPEASTFASWRNETPEDFVFSVKASRFLTHYKRLREPEEAVDRLLERTEALEQKLGPILLQLPPNLPRDTTSLANVLEAFRGRARLACEFRHASWFQDDVYQLMESHDVALCLTDRRNRRSPHVRTASFVVVRLHEGTAAPAPCYGDRALHAWAERLASLFGATAEGFVYFNNDRHACAVRNATTFITSARRAGLEVFEHAYASRHPA